MPYKDKEKQKKYMKNYCYEHREKARERSRQWQKNNSERARESQKQWRERNLEYMKEYNKKYFIKNKDKILKQFKKYRKENPEQRKEYYQKNKDKELKNNHKWKRNNPEYHKEWYQENKEKEIKRSMEYHNNKYKNDVRAKLNFMIGNKIYVALRGNKKGRHWESLVGYTLKDLIKRLEITMPEGYSWQDYLNGKLHIDHIIPIRAFEFENSENKEFKQCWSLYNLRLLPAKKNLMKSNTITNPILLGLLIKSEVKEDVKK